MQTEFRKDTRNQYVVISGEAKCTSLDYRLNMIIENKIECFAQCSVEYMNGGALLYYDITGKTQLSSYLEAYKADTPFYKSLFSGLAAAIESIQEYLLDIDGILLDIEHIFIDADDKKLTFIYYPYNEKGFSDSCKYLSESLLIYIKQDDIDAVRFGYGFYKSCVLGKVNAEALYDMAGSMMKNTVAAPEDTFEGADNKAAGYEELIAERIEESRHGHERTEEKRYKSSLLGKIFKVKESLKNGGYGPDEKRGVRAWLMPCTGKGDTEIMLVKDRYLVGKRAAGADIALNSRAVSRAHAKLVWKEHAYSIVDLSSTNGTKINGMRINEGEKVDLKNGDRIAFADMECIYRQFA